MHTCFELLKREKVKKIQKGRQIDLQFSFLLAAGPKLEEERREN
jgi:hypothetical protein